ncbi:hypothetical protein [Persicobacter diffluens]|uniref:Uncharacterized protein n=1 Tax=Persicobacter diffluens TaxID=981 RepID=A0AAN4VWW2_9BACT|nr:hypothetical protein PEDI_09590 [Persicobacter diffluens]
MIKPLLYFIALLLIFAHPLLAQKNYEKGYIVTNEGDTLHGKIKARRDLQMASSVKFINLKGKKSTKSASELSAYQISNTTYHSFPLVSGVQNKMTFLRLEAAGAVNLYYVEVEYSDTETTPALSQDFKTVEPPQGIPNANDGNNLYLNRHKSRDLTLVERSFFKIIIQNFFGDDQKIVKKVNNRTYRFDDLKDIVEEYNQRHPLPGK